MCDGYGNTLSSDQILERNWLSMWFYIGRAKRGLPIPYQAAVWRGFTQQWHLIAQAAIAVRLLNEHRENP